MNIAAFALSLALGLSAFHPSLAQAEEFPRPPQYVLLAFDGSSSISMWQATRKVARDLTTQGKPTKFTYFISAVYYVGAKYKGDYIPGTTTPIYFAPKHGNSSAIGWGGDSKDLLARSDETNLAHQEGNEIGSHAVGHWDGSTWNYKDWTSEFEQFNNIVTRFYDINKLQPSLKFPAGWLFPVSSIVGFRAPQLGISSSLFQVLKDAHYRYDTSKTASSDYWPKKQIVDDTWNFPLAMLRIAGTGKRTLSMDYNFYVADSGAKPDAANKAIYKKQMLETYLHYFEGNYNGNRAPLSIGHHFSTWNGGAYWEALQEFAAQVCGLPEVKCVTNRELADYMDSLTANQIQAYQAGKFERINPITLASMQPGFDLTVALHRIQEQPGANSAGDIVRVGFGGPGLANAVGSRVVFHANGTPLATVGRDLNLTSVRSMFNGQSVRLTASVLSVDGNEIARATQLLSNAGLPNENLSADIEEDRALQGDLPEAHQE